MRLFGLLIWILCAATSVATAQTYWEPDSRPASFCVQNFNTYGPIYASGVRERTERMAILFRTSPHCDIVHLQEVWNEPQIQILEENLKEVYAISTPNRQARIGLMSLVSGQIQEALTWTFRLNEVGGFLDSVRTALNVKKAFHVLRAKIDRSDEDLYLVNTHLHPSSREVRLTQILDLLNWRLQNQDAKFILSGDLNADVTSLERQFLLLSLGARDSMAEFLGGHYPDYFCTYCAGNPLGWLSTSQTFDYIFYSNQGRAATRLKVQNGDVNMRGSSRSPLSDHFGLRVEFVFGVEDGVLSSSLLEARRQNALRIFTQARDVLALKNQPAFLPYLTQLQGMIEQLHSRSGSYYLFFESFR